MNLYEIINKISEKFNDDYWVHIYSSKNFPEDFFVELGKYKLFGILNSDTYSGYSLTLSDLTNIVYQLSTRIATPTYLFISQNLVAKMIEDFGSNYIKENLLKDIILGRVKVNLALTEEECGNDALCIKTSAKKGANSKYILSGKKSYVTNAKLADYLIIVSRTSLKRERRSYGLTLFLIDMREKKDYFDFYRLEKLGLDFIELYNIRFENLEVESEYIIGGIDMGWNILSSVFLLDKLLLAAMLIGGAEKLLWKGVEYAKQRVVFGKPIGYYQGIQFRLAKAFTEVITSRALMREIIKDQMFSDQTLILSLYYHSVAMANEVADIVLQTFGGKGYVRSLIEMYYRDFRYYRIGPLSEELTLANIARGLRLPKSY